MALGAADVCVPARQRELGAFYRDQRWRGPSTPDRVAIRAQRHSRLCLFGGKLFSMSVIVARFAILGVPLNCASCEPGGAYGNRHTLRCGAPPPAEISFSMVEASNIDQERTLWQASQPIEVPSGRRWAMRSSNSPL